jgi:hypothetical protein
VRSLERKSGRPSKYPFIPRSTAGLIPGQYWSVPLDSGKFGCGRVIEIGARGRPGSRVMFLAGLQDWIGSTPPTAEAIAGTRVLEQAEAHVVMIRETGGAVLGHRPLEADGIEPTDFISSYAGPGVMFHHGLRAVRPATDEERRRLPVLGTWGYRVIEMRARILSEGHRAPPRRLALR